MACDKSRCKQHKDCIECERIAQQNTRNQPMIRIIEVCNPNGMNKETLTYLVKMLKLAGNEVEILNS